MTQRIYLDHAATTPMRSEAIAAMAEGMALWANPSSPHAEGRAARAALEGARERIKAALGWDGELIFTSGASEAAGLALGRAKGGRRLVSAVEHDAMFHAAPDAEVLPIDDRGELDRDRLKLELAIDDRPVVAVQHVNSETGRIQQVDHLAKLVRQGGGVLVSDCAQSAGKLYLPDADMIVVSAHKFGGPPGTGALLVRDYALLQPTGGQETGYRRGTENLLGILGMAAALEVEPLRHRPFAKDAEWSEAMLAKHRPMGDARGRLGDAVDELGGQRVGGHGAHGAGGFSGHIMALAMPGMSAAAQLVRLDIAGFAVSAGSACSSGSLRRSRALEAFGVPEDVAERTIRVSTGWSTTPDEIDRFREAWVALARGARQAA